MLTTVVFFDHLRSLPNLPTAWRCRWSAGPHRFAEAARRQLTEVRCLTPTAVQPSAITGRCQSQQRASGQSRHVPIDVGQIPRVFPCHHDDIGVDAQRGRCEIALGPWIADQMGPFDVPQHAADDVCRRAGGAGRPRARSLAQNDSNRVTLCCETRILGGSGP
jgi:hypothetical protein